MNIPPACRVDGPLESGAGVKIKVQEVNVNNVQITN